MNLPEIKIAPIYEVDLKVLGEKVKYIPYTIAHEKMILTALESKNSEQIINNYLEVLKDCLKDDIDVKNLSIIDFLNLVISIRCKSSDEIINLKKEECDNCGKAYEFDVDLTKNIIYKNEENKKEIVKISDDLTVEMQPLRFDFLNAFDLIKDELDLYIYTAAFSISKIIYQQNIYKNEDSQDLIDKLLINIHKSELKKIFESTKNMITIKLKVDSTCPHCKNEDSKEIDNFLKFFI